MREIDSVKTLKEESDKDHTVNSQIPVEICSWNSYYYPRNKHITSKSNSPRKLPILRNLNQSTELAKSTKRTNYQHPPVYFIKSPYKDYPKSSNKLLTHKKITANEPSSKTFAAQTVNHTPDLYIKLAGLLNNYPCPKRDISPYRSEICKALFNTKTIEELVHRTKMSLPKRKESTRYSTEKRISPLREYKIGDYFRV